jgi:hypothetical protein
VTGEGVQSIRCGGCRIAHATPNRLAHWLQHAAKVTDATVGCIASIHAMPRRPNCTPRVAVVAGLRPRRLRHRRPTITAAKALQSGGPAGPGEFGHSLDVRGRRVPTGRFREEIERLVSIIADRGECLICVSLCVRVVCYGDSKQKEPRNHVDQDRMLVDNLRCEARPENPRILSR